MPLLDATETLSKYPDRLIEHIIPSPLVNLVCSVVALRNHIICQLVGRIASAKADSGSDFDLISTKFAASLGLTVKPQEYELKLMLADEPVTVTSGVVKMPFCIRIATGGGPSNFKAGAEPVDLEFYVLDELNAEVVTGYDILAELKAFDGHDSSFIANIQQLGLADVSWIRWTGSFERKCTKLVQKVLGNGKKNSNRDLGEHISIFDISPQLIDSSSSD